jgi:Ala-tRNA(Pro) deacylase
LNFCLCYLPALFNDYSEGVVPLIGDTYGVGVIFDDCLSDCSDVYFEASDYMALVHVSVADF